jgi:hypothetical protein
MLEDYEETLAKLTIERIGEPTMASFEALCKHLQPIARRLKTTLYQEGSVFGFMVLICEEEEYASYIENPDFCYSDPSVPEEYSAAISDTMTDTQRRAKEEELRRYQIEYNKFLATQSALRNAIVDAIDAEYIEKLRHPVVEYEKVQPYDMLRHIKSQIPLTTEERTNMKNKIFAKWDNTTTLRSYVNQMDLAIKEAAYWNVQVLYHKIAWTTSSPKSMPTIHSK